MYGIIGEDDSDVDALKVIVRSLAGNERLPVMTKGYDGCAGLLRKGARQLATYQALGCTKLVVCHDSDRDDPIARMNELIDKVVVPSKVSTACVAIVPIQELEAWILADLRAVTHVFSGWHPKQEYRSPESIDSPKEFLEKLSRDSRQRPRYSHAIHNSRVAKHLDFDVVYKKCPSFRRLKDFVIG